MAIQFSFGPLIRNQRFLRDSNADGLADGWTASAGITYTHTVDRRGFGVQRITSTGGITNAWTQYIKYRTPAIGVHSGVKFQVPFVATATDTGVKYGIQVIGQPGANVYIQQNGLVAGGTTPLLYTATSADNAGVGTDTYYEIYLHIYLCTAGEYIEFSRSISLSHTFETDAYYYELSITPQVQGTTLGTQGFAEFKRDAAGSGWMADGTGGANKHHTEMAFQWMPQSDIDIMWRLWQHTRSTAGTFGGRPLVIRDTSLPNVGTTVHPLANYNPGYFYWDDNEFPFSAPSNTWFSSTSKFNGVMRLREP